MPITRRQFELGIDERIEEWLKKIHQFLTAHKDEAFTRVELYNHFGLQKTELGVFDAALEKLLGMKAVVEREIRDSHYYSYGPFPLEL